MRLQGASENFVTIKIEDLIVHMNFEKKTCVK
jgi:hypothetical protein